MTEPTFVLALLAGVLAALPYLAHARRLERPEILIALGLGIAAVIYQALAALCGGSPRDLLVETGGVILFGGLAVAGARQLPVLLSIGWVGHVAWDLLLHPVDASGYAPWWYPVACIGFDLVVAGFALALVWTRPSRA
jgi:hypothetical protein